MPSLKGCLLFLASTPLALGAIAGLRPIRRSWDPTVIGKNTTDICTYYVKYGDTAWDIANNKFVESFGLPELYRLNPGLEPRVGNMRVGEPLNVPCLDFRLLPQPDLTGPCTRWHFVKRDETLFTISINETVSIQNLDEWNGLKGSSILVLDQKLCVSKSEPVSCSKHYTVVPGDLCENIANAFETTLPELSRLNPDLLTVSCIIFPGHRLCVAAGDKSPVVPVVPGETDDPSAPATNNAVSPAGNPLSAPANIDFPGPAVVPAPTNIDGTPWNPLSAPANTDGAPRAGVPAAAHINGAPGAVMPAAANINGAPGAGVPALANTASERAGWAESNANMLAQPNGVSSDIRSISPDLRSRVQLIVSLFVGNRTQPGQPNSKAVELSMLSINAAIIAAQSTQPKDVAIWRGQGGFIRCLVKVLLSVKVTIQDGVLQPALPGMTAIESRNPAFDVRMALSVSVLVRKGGHAGAGASPGRNAIPQSGQGQPGASPNGNTVPQGGHGQPSASPDRNTVPQGGQGQPGSSPSHNGYSASPDRAATNGPPNHISLSQDVRIKAGGSPNSVRIDASTESGPQRGAAGGGAAVCQ